MELVKHIACIHFYVRGETQSSERSKREKIEKMIGRLYKANILIIEFVRKIHTFVC